MPTGLRKPGAVAQFGGKTLDALMLSATLNPGQLSIVREIVDGDMDNTATDVAVYGDLRANYIDHEQRRRQHHGRACDGDGRDRPDHGQQPGLGRHRPPVQHREAEVRRR